MKRLLQLAAVFALGVTGLFVLGVQLRDTPSTAGPDVGAPSPEIADRRLPAKEFDTSEVQARSDETGTIPAEGHPEVVQPENDGPDKAHPVRAEAPAPASDGARPDHNRPQDAAERAGRAAETRDGAAEPAQAAAPAVVQDQNAPAPTFDVVRVNRSGDAVIAGRAEPNSEVEVTDGDSILGRVRSDRRGEWVVVPEQPLQPGAREIGIVSRDEGGLATESESVVVVSVPDPQQTASTENAGGGSAVAVLVPREGVRPSKVLQGPVPVASAAPEPAPTSERPSSRSRRASEPEGSVRIAAVGPAHDPASGALAEKPSVPEAGLSVETVDYDETGRVALSGTAEPGAQVSVYLDDTKIGEARVDAGGRWEMTPQEDVSPGRYTLRADELASSGDVTDRIRLPFSRAEAFGDLAPGTLVVVQPGNSLWRIARRTYGKGERYTLIYRSNQRQIDDPDLIYPGQVFSLPETAPTSNEDR